MNIIFRKMSSLIFQFHKGAIRTVISITSFLLFANFNSIKVRLEHEFVVTPEKYETYFNSIKVRLEPCNLIEICIGFTGFQFHKGAIRTYTAYRLNSPRKRFQFHKGAIRTNILINHDSRDLNHFNSIKVRLELNANTYPDSYVSFQFHKGAIRTLCVYQVHR